jgi:hypothetical protein
MCIKIKRKLYEDKCNFYYTIVNVVGVIINEQLTCAGWPEMARKKYKNGKAITKKSVVKYKKALLQAYPSFFHQQMNVDEASYPYYLLP